MQRPRSVSRNEHRELNQAMEILDVAKLSDRNLLKPGEMVSYYITIDYITVSRETLLLRHFLEHENGYQLHARH